MQSRKARARRSRRSDLRVHEDVPWNVCGLARNGKLGARQSEGGGVGYADSAVNLMGVCVARRLYAVVVMEPPMSVAR